MSRFLVLLGTLSAFGAFAWPIEKAIELEPGKDKVIRMGTVDWFEVDDPKTVSVELLDSGNEMLLTPLKPNGRALLLTFAEGKPQVWSLRIGRVEPVKTLTAAVQLAQKSCPKLAFHPDDYEALVGEVPDAKCRTALLELLKSDSFDAKSTSLTFDPAVLVEQQKDIRSALDAIKSPLKVHYEGATLVLEGSADPKLYRKSLWEAFRHSACRIALDDRSEQPDAGTPPVAH